MRAGVILVAVGVLVGASASLGFGALRDDDETAGEQPVAELAIEPSTTGGPQGVGLLRQQGERLSGSVVVWGLEPGSRHAVHFHGPDSSCGTKADPVAVHPDLEADADGVASAQVDIAAPNDILRPGFYYNVHAESSAVSDNPEIACGDLLPNRK
jgi:hypothetical protein